MITRRSKSPIDIWPGFVDALASLLIVLIFVLMIFVIGQFSLSQQIDGQESELGQLNRKLANISELLSLEQKKSSDLSANVTRLEGELAASLKQYREASFAEGRLQAELTSQRAELSEQQQAFENLEQTIAALQARRNELLDEIASRDKKLDEESQKRVLAESQTSLLNQQLAEIKEQLHVLEALLSDYEERDKAAKVQIADLGKRLNVALAGKVNELASYRSEFFGRLKAIIGSRQEIEIVGDRFVFQSEVLFAEGSAILGAEGRQQLGQLASTLKEIAADIPSEINWLLQVEGHTDKTPINNATYRSNWELSQARALAVVRYLIGQDIAPQNLSAAGYASFQPLSDGDTAADYAKNRRIELKLTNR